MSGVDREPCRNGWTPPDDVIFAPFRNADPGRPFVVAQLGQSLDGRIATPSGESKYINGEAALDHLHRMRALVDAVVVGASTIEKDDPQLTVRRVAGRSPARVVIDPRGRLSACQGRWLACDGTPLFVVTGSDTVPGGTEAIHLAPDSSGLIGPERIVEALFKRGLRRILIEGGARTISAFLEAGCLDRLHVLIAPVILGSGRAGLDLPPILSLKDALRPRAIPYILPGSEVLFDCILK